MELEVLGQALRCGGGAQDVDSDDEEQKASSEFVNNLLAGINKLFAVKAAITIGIFNTIARAGPGAFLSIHEIAKGIGSTKTIHIQNLCHLMKALLVFGFFIATYGEPADPPPTAATSEAHDSTWYGLNKDSRLFVKNHKLSVAPIIVGSLQPCQMKAWCYMHEAIFSGQYPFTIANGKVSSHSSLKFHTNIDINMYPSLLCFV
jgi:hypothetical protein